jgi:hypothetical protein
MKYDRKKKSQFLAMIAALYLAMSFGNSVVTSFKVRFNALEGV